MSVNSRGNSLRSLSSVLVLILLWMGSGAVLKHTCSDDFVLDVHAGASHVTAPHLSGSPDQCAACAWVDAINVYLPSALAPPFQKPFVFEAYAPISSRVDVPLIRTILTRGPPSIG